ncbi:MULTISPECIES: helix-turn-helix domain-containing protein [Kordiimonas]|jgi:AraC-like DNA-binding protein|uniref:helix-turn-helix domain-containing protein n=1 Tax=Kordiimonas TaxID=288021 RepID=UPI00257A81D2|nr:helix-turn-helix transcriptional regulator [Kordiimonas sp. UBA4487]
MKDTAILAIVMATLGQVGLSLTLLLSRGRNLSAALPLTVFLLTNGMVAAMPVAAVHLLDMRATLVAAMPPAYLLLGPSLWFYVKGLTAETPWHFTRKEAWHLLPVGLGIVATVLILVLPVSLRDTAFFGQADDSLFLTESGQVLFPGYVMIYLFGLVFLWLLQMTFYVAQTARALLHYRKRLKDLFANNDDRELTWLGGILILVAGLWLVTFMATVWDNVFDQRLMGKEASAGLSLVLVWCMSLWGLRQKPGFEGRYQEGAEAAEDIPPKHNGGKYRRSALTTDKAERIASKIKTAMERDQLYLDSSLSLQHLARHIGASANNVSQTLNETLGATFFDYVNSWRIKAAKPMVAKGEETLLDISLAVGFNARSSFNKAFKQHAGQTPSAFRNSQS